MTLEFSSILRNGRVLLLSTIAASFTAFAPAAHACNLAAKSTRPIIPVLRAPTELMQEAPTAQAHIPPTIVGLWKVDVMYQGQVVDQAFETFHADGTELLVDTTPPAEGNVCSGVWDQTGPLTYKLNHPSWAFDANGNLLGTAIIRVTITLERNGSTYTGTATEDDYDLQGSKVRHSESTARGTRITVNSSPL